MPTIKLGYEDGMYLLRLVKQVESLQRDLNISDTGMQNLAKAKRALVGALGTSDDDGAITGLPSDDGLPRPSIADIPLNYLHKSGGIRSTSGTNEDGN